METYNLFDNRYAVRFPYHMVTEMTVYKALPRELKGRTIKFSAESAEEAGTKRMDSETIRKAFPAECALFDGTGGNPKEFILIEVV